jgi:SM-20-related protein
MNIRTELINNKKIYLIDNVVSNDAINEFYGFVKGLRFNRNERDHETDEYPIFSVDFHPEAFETETEIGKTARNLVTEFFNEQQYVLFRSYINMSHYGDVEYPHRDCPLNRNDITVLYYVNNQWDYTWGGETMFYENGDTRLAVLPTPGRFVIFYGAIEHIGSIPTRVCKTSRLSLALKYKQA